MKNNKKIIAVLPAYNAEKTLKQTLDEIPRDWVDEIILVDDASIDGTVALSKSLGVKTFVHKKNSGYGGNQKTCYQKALESGADIVQLILLELGLRIGHFFALGKYIAVNKVWKRK